METLILKDKNIPPTNEVLASVLESSFPAFEELSRLFAEEGLIPEWNYYNDGKAWLCKILSKKKNLGWLVPYQGYFKVTAYFTEKHLDKIAGLDVSENIKEEFYRSKLAGKLIPMPIIVSGKKQIQDVLNMILFKKGLK